MSQAPAAGRGIRVGYIAVRVEPQAACGPAIGLLPGGGGLCSSANKKLEIDPPFQLATVILIFHRPFDDVVSSFERPDWCPIRILLLGCRILGPPLPALDCMPLPVVVEFDRDENMLP